MRTLFGGEMSFRQFQSDLRKLMDFILDAVLTVSPNRQYRGRMEPTIPAMQGPVRNCSKIVNSEQNFFKCVNNLVSIQTGVDANSEFYPSVSKNCKLFVLH